MRLFALRITVKTKRNRAFWTLQGVTPTFQAHGGGGRGCGGAGASVRACEHGARKTIKQKTLKTER